MQRVRLETFEHFRKYMSKRYGLELSSPLHQLQYCFEGWSEVLKQYITLIRTTLTYSVVAMECSSVRIRMRGTDNGSSEQHTVPVKSRGRMHNCLSMVNPENHENAYLFADIQSVIIAQSRSGDRT